MVKGILGILLFIFLVIVFILMLTGSYLLRKFRELRKAAADAAEQQAFRYREETGRQRQQYNQSTQSTQTSQGTQQTQSEQPRRTQTATGETIIDHRHQERENKKIFDDSDGEYVEFTEEA